MIFGKTGKDAGRPRQPSKLVYDDWHHGLHVRGWATESEDTVYVVYTRGHYGSILCTNRYVREWWEALMGDQKHAVQKSYVLSALGASAPGGKGACASDASLAETCPALHEFLTLCVLPGGATRSPATLLVFSEGGLWKAVLNERDAGLNLWATAESLQGLWSELEARLTAPVVDWRPARPRTSAPAQPRAIDKPKRKR